MERALFRRRNVFARRLPHLLVFVYRRRENHSDLNAAAAPASTRQRRVAKEKSGHDNGETSMENRPKPEDTKTKDCASVEASKRVYTTTLQTFTVGSSKRRSGHVIGDDACKSRLMKIECWQSRFKFRTACHNNNRGKLNEFKAEVRVFT
jgi:hypothetical protein